MTILDIHRDGKRVPIRNPGLLADLIFPKAIFSSIALAYG